MMMKSGCIAALGCLLAACSQGMHGGDGGDAAPTDGSVDVVHMDGADVGPQDGMPGDVPVNTDVPIGTDTAMDDVQPGVDVPIGVDVPVGVDAGCTGPAPTIAITQPTSGTVIETCSPSGAPIFYDFITTTTGSIASIQVNWVNGTTPFAAPWTLPAPSPYTAHRLVGGNPTPDGQQPLFRASGSVPGMWHFTATGTDACGRTVSTMANFTLRYTTHSCPNP